MADIKDVAVAYWRMERWLESTDVERKMAAKSALKAIKRYLDGFGVEARDITGAQFDPGLAVSVVNNESDETDESKLLIIEMVRPIIMEKGAVIEFGQVIIGDKLREKKTNAPEKIIEQNSIEQHKENEDLLEMDQVNLQETYSEKKNHTVFLGIVGVLLVALLVGNTIHMHNEMEKLHEENSKLFSAVENSVELTSGSNTQLIDNEKVEGLEKQIDVLEAKIDALVEQETKPNAADENQQEKYIMYTIQAGDTVSGICKQFGVHYYDAINEIKSLNNLENENEIKIGQILKIPVKGE